MHKITKDSLNDLFFKSLAHLMHISTSALQICNIIQVAVRLLKPSISSLILQLWLNSIIKSLFTRAKHKLWGKRKRVLANKERGSASISWWLIYNPFLLLNMMSLQLAHESRKEAAHTAVTFPHNPRPASL